jgi:hypothetical protein
MSIRCLRNALIISLLLWFWILFFISMAHAQITVGIDPYTDVATEFRIYVSSTSGGVIVALVYKPITMTTFVIPAQALFATKSYIRMTAYDAARGMESLPSNEVIYTKPTTTTTSIPVTTTTTSVIVAPVKPGNLRILPQ